jgi:hypothetical protein
MFRDAVVRGGPKHDLFRRDLRGVRLEALLQPDTSTPRIRVRRSVGRPLPKEPTALACSMAGYSQDCELEASCQKTNCFWHKVPTC